jgi:ribosomal protein S27E
MDREQFAERVLALRPEGKSLRAIVVDPVVKLDMATVKCPGCGEEVVSHKPFSHRNSCRYCGLQIQLPEGKLLETGPTPPEIDHSRSGTLAKDEPSADWVMRRASRDKANNGSRLLRAGAYEDAIAACSEAIELDPNLGARRNRSEARRRSSGGLATEAEGDC